MQDQIMESEKGSAYLGNNAHWISKEQLRQHAISMGSNEYAAYLCSLLDL
ncbi:hypothetical protein [Shewanella algae]|nr:hypothetical protein [Shewanella algae]WKC43267.1 hypothetical protein QYM03_07435 [Shewanella algae]